MNHKHYLHFLCCFFLMSTAAFSQKSSAKVLYEEKKLGKNLITGSDIIGGEFIFPDKIHSFFNDTLTNFLTVQLKKRKNSGIILQYDLLNKKQLWYKAINYDINELLKFDTLLVFNDYNEAMGLNTKTGETLWNVKNYIYLANPVANIGFSYLYIAAGEGYYTNDFIGIDFVKRNLKWKRNINREHGWNDYFYLNDSTLMVVASGLHTVNINTGIGWDYNTLTGEGKEG